MRRLATALLNPGLPARSERGNLTLRPEHKPRRFKKLRTVPSLRIALPRKSLFFGSPTWPVPEEPSCLDLVVIDSSVFFGRASVGIRMRLRYDIRCSSASLVLRSFRGLR